MKNREKYKNELIKVIKKDGKLCETQGVEIGEKV